MVTTNFSCIRDAQHLSLIYKVYLVAHSSPSKQRPDNDFWIVGYFSSSKYYLVFPLSHQTEKETLIKCKSKIQTLIIFNLDEIIIIIHFADHIYFKGTSQSLKKANATNKKKRELYKLELKYLQ